MRYKKIFGQKLDLNNPKTLNEKIQWLKLFYNNTEYHTKCADKLSVKTLIKDLIGDQYVVPLVYSTSNYLNINEKNIPDFPVIIKANHNSGGYFIIKNNKIADWNKIQRECKKWLKQNYYYIGKEF